MACTPDRLRLRPRHIAGYQKHSPVGDDFTTEHGLAALEQSERRQRVVEDNQPEVRGRLMQYIGASPSVSLGRGFRAVTVEVRLNEHGDLGVHSQATRFARYVIARVPRRVQHHICMPPVDRFRHEHLSESTPDMSGQIPMLVGHFFPEPEVPPCRNSTTSPSCMT